MDWNVEWNGMMLLIQVLFCHTSVQTRMSEQENRSDKFVLELFK